ncbi:hypothetical protein BN906_01965 [Clostridium tetani 12124569]|nr:hypothetical protein BN906_01965 [Clostridium tetani 12124569]
MTPYYKYKKEKFLEKYKSANFYGSIGKYLYFFYFQENSSCYSLYYMKGNLWKGEYKCILIEITFWTR